MTNGCFDLLHPGHIRALAEARAMGDCLLVALNTDDSVTRLKGAPRPLMPLVARAEMLLALSSVKWVLSFGNECDDTPTQLIAEVRPDVLVKGADYAPGEIAGADIVRNSGGIVARLTYHADWSTTELIARIKDLDGAF